MTCLDGLGGKDFAFQELERSRFETLFPNHQTVLLKNAGHFIREDAAQEIVMAIRAWRLAPTKTTGKGQRYE